LGFSSLRVQAVLAAPPVNKLTASDFDQTKPVYRIAGRLILAVEGNIAPIFS
jgi:hypothetical protein